MDTTKLTLFSLISKGIALKILTLLFLVCNIQVNSTELSVFGQCPLECFGLIKDKLHMKIALTVQFCNLFFQHIDHFLS